MTDNTTLLATDTQTLTGDEVRLVPDAPATEVAAPEKTQDAPPEEPRSEPTEGEKTPEPETPSWGKTPEEALAHDDFRPFLEEREKTAYKKAYSDVQSRMQPFLTQQSAQFESIDKGVAAIVKQLNRAVKDQTLDAQAVSDLLDEHRGTIDALGGAHQELGKWAGAKAFVADIGRALSDQQLAAEYSVRLDNLARNIPDPTLFTDLVQRVAEKRIESVRTKEVQPLRAELQKQKDIIEKMKAEGRTNQGPNLAPTSSAGGRTEREELLDPNTPIERLREIRARQQRAE